MTKSTAGQSLPQELGRQKNQCVAWVMQWVTCVEGQQGPLKGFVVLVEITGCQVCGLQLRSSSTNVGVTTEAREWSPWPACANQATVQLVQPHTLQGGFSKTLMARFDAAFNQTCFYLLAVIWQLCGKQHIIQC